MEIILNGKPRPVTAGLTVAALIDELGLQGRRIAVERNGEIVPRSEHAATRLADGDRLEVIHAVGGG